MGHQHRYSVTLRPEPEGGFTVRVPAFPEIVTFGTDETEALANAKEAIELSIEHYLAEGLDIPQPESTRLEHVTVLVPTAA